MYRAPLAVSPLSPPIRATVRNLMLLFGIAMAGCGATGIAMLVLSDGTDRRPDTALALIGLAWLAHTLSSILGVFWAYKAWSWIPVEHRYTKSWNGMISPGTAAGFLFIPYFQYYWMFVLPLGMCEAIERLQVSHGRQSPTPRNLAITAAVSQFLFFPAPFLWFAFARQIERHMHELTGGAK